MLNQDWYWITLWCIWMQKGFVFIYTVIPCFSHATMWALSLGKAGLSAWQEGFWDHVLQTYTLWNTTQASLGGSPAGLALKEGTWVPLMGDLSGESSTSCWGEKTALAGNKTSAWQSSFRGGKCDMVTDRRVRPTPSPLNFQSRLEFHVPSLYKAGNTQCFSILWGILTQISCVYMHV